MCSDGTVISHTSSLYPSLLTPSIVRGLAVRMTVLLRVPIFSDKRLKLPFTKETGFGNALPFSPRLSASGVSAVP